MNIQELAISTGLTYDRGKDTRLFLDSMSDVDFDFRSIDVFAQFMSKKEYSDMEKHMKNYKLCGQGYSIYVWNDSSGYNYWKEDGMGNYIQITVDVENIDLIDVHKMMNDVEQTYYEFDRYCNIENYIQTLE
jgi:hypothetical protein